jgi:hypothetical protein
MEGFVGVTGYVVKSNGLQTLLLDKNCFYEV